MLGLAGGGYKVTSFEHNLNAELLQLLSCCLGICVGEPPRVGLLLPAALEARALRGLFLLDAFGIGDELHPSVSAVPVLEPGCFLNLFVDLC